MHSPTTDLIVLGEAMSPAGFKETREAALEKLRLMCAECRGCVRFDLKPP